ncbi:MAG TPA: hypothetical protein VFU63_06260 [Ktedonobacterales bacterium]|nr:hypothetical protein [Ktedonobacterales bacterium]
MTSDFTRSARAYRLASYYLGKLRTVDEAMRRGQVHISYGKTVFDQEWEQIRHWQQWTTQREPDDQERARLCRDFALTGLEVLANRVNRTEHSAWLRAALEAAKQLDDRGAERILCYELMMMNYRSGSLDMGKQLADRLLQLGEAANDILCTERAYFGLAVYCEERGMYAEAEQNYQRALRLSNQLGLAIEAGRALNALGGVAQYVGEFDKSYQYCAQYLELMETRGEKTRVCHALLSVGESLISLKAFSDAERHLQRAVRMCRALGLHRLLGVGLLTLGVLRIEEGKLEAAQVYLEEGLLEVRAVGVQRQIMYGLTRLGYIAARSGDYTAALGHLHEALAMSRAVGNPRYIGDVQLQLAYAYLALDDESTARVALYESLRLALALGSRSQKVRNLSGAIAHAEKLGQHERAALWTGTIMGESVIDLPVFAPICARLEAALGHDGYQAALEKGRLRSLDDVVNEAMTYLA